MAKWGLIMGDEELEGSNMVFKWPSKKQRHSNVRLANFMGLKSIINPHTERNIHVCSIISSQGRTSEA